MEEMGAGEKKRVCVRGGMLVISKNNMKEVMWRSVSPQSLPLSHVQSISTLRF